MPSEARRLHGFSVVSESLALARQLILPAVVGGASAGDDLSTTLQWVALILSVPSILLAVARWLAFRFRLDDDELIIDSGVLSRRRRVIPLARIQNIDLQQSALQRLAGVAELRLETASGSGDTEASLSVLGLEQARRLQRELVRRRAQARSGDGRPADAAGVEAAPGPETRPRRLLRISVPRLALAGATSNEAGLIAAGLATLLQFLDELAGLDRVEAWLEGVYTSGTEVGVLGVAAFVAVLALVFVLTGWALSVIVTVVRYYGFTLTRVGEDIRREYGLLSRHHSTVPLERVQAVRVEETLLRRPLGLVALKIETAGAGPEQRQRSDGQSEAFVPIARRRDVGPLLREVFPDARFDNVELHRVSRLSLRRGFVRLAVPIALITVVAVALLGPRWTLLGGLLLPAWLYARAAYLARGWARPGGYTLVRGGVATRVSWVVPERKIQTLHLVDNPFQRRLRLSTMLVDTAAGGRIARVIDLENDTARRLLHDLAVDAEAARAARVAGSARGS